jgi:hypothetical protein
MIRLTEDVVNEIQKRGCAPLESFAFSIRLKMWPIFQKVMSDHVDELKKYAEGASSGGFFGRGVVTTDASVANVMFQGLSGFVFRPYRRAPDLQTIHNNFQFVHHANQS